MNDPGGDLPDFSSSVPVSGTELFFILKAEMTSERVQERPTGTSALPGQVWKLGPAHPVTGAALPPAQRFRVWGFCSRGSLTPVAAPNASPNVFLAGDRMRRSGFGATVLRDVALRPSVETGADVPGYSGGFPACAAVSYLGLL